MTFIHSGVEITIGDDKTAFRFPQLKTWARDWTVIIENPMTKSEAVKIIPILRKVARAHAMRKRI